MGNTKILFIVGVFLIPIIIILAVIAVIYLMGKNYQNRQQELEHIEISFTNQLNESDIWIIPDTESNRKTTTWGTATLSKMKINDKKSAYIVKSIKSENSYLIRLIDVDKMFYSADAVIINNNDSIIIKKGNEPMSAIVEVYDSNGKINASYEMFMAKL